MITTERTAPAKGTTTHIRSQPLAFVASDQKNANDLTEANPMHLTFQTTQLKSAYTAAAAAVPTKTAKDVLKRILLQSTPTGCRLVGGDLI